MSRAIGKMWLVSDKIDPRRTAIVGPCSLPEARRLFEQERLTVIFLSGMDLIRAMRDGYPVIEAKEGDKEPGDEGV